MLLNHIFTCMLDTSVSSWRKCQYTIFFHFFGRVVGFLLPGFMNALCFLDIRCLSDVRCEKYFILFIKVLLPSFANVLLSSALTALFYCTKVVFFYTFSIKFSLYILMDSFTDFFISLNSQSNVALIFI